MSSLITADWFPVGKDCLFRKIELYKMAWSVDLVEDDLWVVPAQYGGPIAVVRDQKKLIKAPTSNKPIITIYSSAGNKISAILWNSGKLVHMGWSSEEKLLCVKNDGQVLVYDMFGSLISTFTMGEEASVTKIFEAKIFFSSFGTGLAVLTTKRRVFLVNSVVDPKVRLYPPLPSELEDPSGWEIVSEKQTNVIISNKKVLTSLRLGETPTTMYPEFREPWTGLINMAVSLDNKHIALLTNTGLLWLGSSDMNRKYCEIDTKWESPARQIVWCGIDAIVVNWSNKYLVVSRNGGEATISSSGPTWLAPEIDGVRAIGSFSHEIIQRVLNVTKNIFSINSTDPGSYLFEACKQFERKSHTSYDYINLVRDKMELAVSQCLEGAGYEFDTEVQKSLLRAAKLGRTFSPDAHTTECVNMCRVLRVLNAVRNAKIGIPLTYMQLNQLGLRTLLDRLVYRRFYKVAIEMAEYLKLSNADGAGRILAHWACYKVKQAQIDEEALAIEIGRKLEFTSGVSFSEIASQAINAGKTQLALKLLEFESQTNLQVPLLLMLKQRKLALERAITCGDTDLVLCVMLSLRETMPLGDFQLLIRSYPLAQSLYIKYCRLHSPETLRDIYVQEDDYCAQAQFFLRDYLDSKNSSKEASLNSAVECYSKGKQEFLVGVCKDQQKLLNQQKNLNEKFEKDFVGKSLYDTIQMLLEMREVKLAEKMKTEHKMTDQRFWWLRLLTLSDKKDWEEIEKLAKSKKSPIGYEPFVDVCLKHQNHSEAAKYLGRVSEELKIKYYVRAGKLDEAVNMAFEQRDADALRYILSSCGSKQNEITAKINRCLTQLSTRK